MASRVIDNARAAAAELQAYGVERIYHPNDGMQMGLVAMIEDLVQRTVAHRVPAAKPQVVSKDDEISVGKMLTAIEEGQFDVATLFFAEFKSVISQVPTAKQLVPAVVEGGSAPINLNGAVYDYEPSEEEILETLLPRNITVQILAALLENMAGFYASQMTAMDNATRNAGDMINGLTIKYNRTRQAQITKELIEIISGAEAL